MLHVFRSSVGYTRPISQPSSGDERGDTNSGRVAVVPSYCHHQTCSDLLFYRFYKALFSALEQIHCAHVTPDSEWVIVSFYSTFNFHCSGVLTTLFGCCMAGTTWNCCHLYSLYTIQSCTSLQCHFIETHKVAWAKWLAHHMQCFSPVCTCGIKKLRQVCTNTPETWANRFHFIQKPESTWGSGSACKMHLAPSCAQQTRL